MDTAFFKYFLIFLLFLSCSKKSHVEEPLRFNNILILGNSITRNAPAPDIGWNGDWGMAASAQDKDYVHILIKRFKEKDEKANVSFKNIADFETGYWNYDFSKLEDLKNLKPDLLILRIGENVKETDMDSYSFKAAYLKLIDYFKVANPSIRIICASSFWDQPRREAEIAEASKARNLPFVSIKYLSADLTNTAFGIFSHPGVASHPSDKGMQEIANLIWAEVEKF